MRVICIGNRFYYPDNFGILVYEELIKLNLECEIVEGGVGGMNLFPYFEDDKKILIIDYLKGFDKNILTQNDIKNIQLNEYNHSTAFLYLLKSIDKPYTIFGINEEFKSVKKYIPQILEILEKL